MFKVDIPPETPTWRQEFNACENCERLEEEKESLVQSLHHKSEELLRCQE
jgi:hypothetical protein